MNLKDMFGFFKRKNRGDEGEDPLSDLKTVSRWLENLPTGDIYSAQEQVVQSLIQFNHAGMAMSRERLQILMRLDEQARDMQHSLCMQYLRNPRMSKVIESRLWTAIHAFFWEVTRGYHAFLMDFVANPGGSRIQQHIPLIAARALRGFGDIFKWRYFRYERSEEKLWMRMHNIFRISEFEGFHDNRFKLYEQESTPSSCMEEYVRSLLLSPLGTGSLTPRQIEMVDRWLVNWARLTPIDTHYNSERHFFLVDTTLGQGLRRIRPKTNTEPSYRYLSTQALLAHIEETEQALRGGAMPVSLGLGEEFRLPDGFDLINQVRNEWSHSTERERRASIREPAEGRCEVVYDLANICQRLKTDHAVATGIHSDQALTPEEILDIKLYGFVTERTKAAIAQRLAGQGNQEVERWNMRDRSDTGLGILLQSEQSEWVRVGKLLGLRLDPTGHWRLGIIRRLTRQSDDWRQVGMSVLPGEPVLAHIQSTDPQTVSYSVDGSSIGGEDTRIPVLILHGDEDGPSIVMEASKYAHGRQYQLHLEEEVSLISLETVLDKGDGWLIASYTPLG